MADRYEDFDRNRDRERERDRDASRRFDDYRRESRGEEYGEGGREYGRDREYGREERGWGSREPYGSESRYGGGFGTRTSEGERERRGDWRRERPEWTSRGTGGGMGAYTGQDWREQGYGSYGGGMGEGFGRGGERGYRERGGSRQGAYGEEETYRGRAYGTEPYRGGAYGEAGAYGGERRTGRFTGRGPKGYQRSDERIREDICERLTQHPEIDASEIEIQVNNGQVTLAGSVDDRHQKRMAEDVVEELSGVQDVHNQLRVSKGLARGWVKLSGFAAKNSAQAQRGKTSRLPHARRSERTRAPQQGARPRLRLSVEEDDHYEANNGRYYRNYYSGSLHVFPRPKPRPTATGACP